MLRWYFKDYIDCSTVEPLVKDPNTLLPLKAENLCIAKKNETSGPKVSTK